MTEELWEKFGMEGYLSLAKWPEYDESKMIDDEIEIVIQINGKVKDKIMIAAGLSDEEIKEAG